MVMWLPSGQPSLGPSVSSLRKINWEALSQPGLYSDQGDAGGCQALSSGQRVDRARRQRVFTSTWTNSWRERQGWSRALRSGVGSLVKNNGITLVTGKAAFVDPKTIEVESEKGREQFGSAKTIIATGSVSAQLPSVAVDGKVILTSTEMLNLSTVPKDLVVIGGGYIGMEFACLFNGLGSNVTVIEMLPEILTTEDEEIARGLITILKKRGIRIFTETKVKEAKVKGGHAEVTVTNKEGKEEVFKAEKALMAVGRSPYTDGLQLEKAGVALNGKFIKVNERMETTCPGDLCHR